MRRLFQVEASDEVHELSFAGLRFPVIRSKLIGLIVLVWMLELLLLTAAIQFFDYEMTSADPGGGLLAGFLLAYLIHIVVIQQHENKA